MLKRRSNEDIIQFIRELPGGNPTQYAKLLSTTAIRINALLHTKEGKKLARNNQVVAAERGLIPTWSFTEKRGCLKGRDIDVNNLPPFIADMLNRIHPQYREDALEFLRDALDQTAGHRSFEDQITSAMEQTKHHTDEIVDHLEVIAHRDAEISRFDRILSQARDMATLLEDQTTRKAERLPSEQDFREESGEGVAEAV